MLGVKFIELLMMTVPALLVVVVALFYFNKAFYNEERKLDKELELQRMKKVLPTQVQAYERLLIFLERIKMENLIKKSHAGTTAAAFREEIVTDINREFQHNIAQQLHMSKEVWFEIEKARLTTIGLINSLYKKLQPQTPSTDFAELLTKAHQKIDTHETQAAINLLKDEFRERFK